MDHLFNDFVAEAEKILKDLEASICLIGDLDPDHHTKPEAINTLFRQVHSLKGLSGMFRLDGISRLSHRIEVFLNGARLGRFHLSDEALDLLGKGRRILREMVRSVGEDEGEGSADAASFLRELEELERGPDNGRRENLSALIGVPDQVMKTLSEYEEHRFRENISRGIPFFRVCCSLPMDSFDGELRKLGSSIREIGELLTTMPDTSLVSKSSIGLTLYFASGEPEEEVRAKMGLYGKGLEKIPYRRESI